MYLLITFSIITFIYLFFEWKNFKMRSCENDFPGYSILIIFLATLTYFMVLIGGRWFYENKHNLNTYEYRDLPVVSLTNEEGWKVSGSFIIGIGGFSGGSYSYYVTYGKFNQGLKKLELSDTRYYIRETNSQKPCIPNYWKIDVKKAYESKWFWNREYSRSDYTRVNYNAKTIVVPENTIYKEFNVKY